MKVILTKVQDFKKASWLTPLFMILEVIFETIIPVVMGMIIDISEGDNIDMARILGYGGLMVVLALGALYTGIMGGKYGALASAGLAKNLRRDMFRNIQGFSFANIDKFSSASLVTRMTTDVTNVQNAYQMILRTMARSPVNLIVAMVAAFLISPRVALVYLVAVVFLSIVGGILISKVTKYFTAAFPKYDEMNESVQENVTSVRVVKGFVREDYERKRFSKASGMIYKLFVKAESIMALAMPLMQSTIYFCILMVSWTSAKLIIAEQGMVGGLTTGDLSTLLAYCMQILMSLMMLSMVIVMITMSSASVKRIAEVIEEESTLKNPDNPIKEIKDGSIDFENVIFRYNENSENPVLDNINLHINSGETIGIIGPTGSSKTSLVNLISRLYDVSDGSVKVGGLDVRKYDMEDLRNNVAVVLQKNVLFSGTIMENLRWGNKEATDEECKEACRLAAADDFIESFPDKYDTKLEQGGTNVSGGQKQRICIARALLKKPKVLILDDSTSAVDTATDSRIRQSFREFIPDTTKIIIAQRISSVMDADRIIVLNEGRLEGFGSHEELLKTNEIYRDVFESQQGGSKDFDD
ncbi:MAG: ABC transporter ATP-binding protein/permease [Eubacterium sp.]|nr:ABC transporter ATP-binding protein/permease [Eubacterium sp.]